MNLTDHHHQNELQAKKPEPLHDQQPLGANASLSSPKIKELRERYETLRRNYLTSLEKD